MNHLTKVLGLLIFAILLCASCSKDSNCITQTTKENIVEVKFPESLKTEQSGYIQLKIAKQANQCVKDINSIITLIGVDTFLIESFISYSLNNNAENDCPCISGNLNSTIFFSSQKPGKYFFYVNNPTMANSGLSSFTIEVE